MGDLIVAYLAGLATLPVLVVLYRLFDVALATGTRVECLRCGHSTGAIDTTPRIVVELRWRWHELTAHRSEGTD
ncbi:hypothetical protein [Aeromicrobium sp. HA]|uniref:hypothetical protein n=1 Tax=Aeromicrobium sp. HA TaxID=3009077 RepID=UPI0022AF7758|nr:hypothetical protein [Aeromicrobium sp. HA]